MWKTYYVYILASQRNGTLYVGVTNDIVRRAWQHREGILPGFTQKYGVKALVHFETFENIDATIRRESRLKKWIRRWTWNSLRSRIPTGAIFKKISSLEQASSRWPAFAGHDSFG